MTSWAILSRERHARRAVAPPAALGARPGRLGRCRAAASERQQAATSDHWQGESMRLLRHAFGLSLAGVLVTACATAQAPPVRPRCARASTCCVEDSLHLVAGRAVGLLTNRTGVDRRGVGDVERLRAAGVQPRGAVHAGTRLSRGRRSRRRGGLDARQRHRATNLQSLWPRFRAHAGRCWPGVQVLLVDLQDAGARYFTYVSTTIELMRSAGARGHPRHHSRPAEPDRRRGAGQRARQRCTLVRRAASRCRCGTG